MTDPYDDPELPIGSIARVVCENADGTEYEAKRGTVKRHDVRPHQNRHFVQLVTYEGDLPWTTNRECLRPVSSPLNTVPTRTPPPPPSKPRWTRDDVAAIVVVILVFAIGFAISIWSGSGFDIEDTWRR